jgi:hypothetical protein
MGKVADALKGVKHLGLDSSPFIYFVERNPTYLDLCREVIRLIDTGTIIGYSSVVTLTEVLIPIARAEFTIAPLLKVPPASRGEPRGARGFGSPCLQGEP